MTPHIWHACTPWIARNHSRLSRVAAGLLLLAGMIIVVVAIAGLPNKFFLPAFSAVSAAFGVLCLGMIEQWFKVPPPQFGERPVFLIFLWSGAMFYNVFLFLCLAFTVLGILGLIAGGK